MYKATFDGSANPNPGVIGIGFSVTKDKQEVMCGAKRYGTGTNNRAEYLALIWLLEECLERNIRHLHCYGDSQLVVKQVNGEWNVAKDNLKLLNKRAKELMGQFDQISLAWLKREQNTRADTLSKRGAQLQEAKVHIVTPTLLPAKTILSSPQTEKVKSTASTDNHIDRAVTKIRVFVMQNNELAIVDGNSQCYFHTIKGTCTCRNYLEHGNCVHKEAFNKTKVDSHAA